MRATHAPRVVQLTRCNVPPSEDEMTLAGRTKQLEG